MTLSIKLRDNAGDIAISLDDLMTYHDTDHYGGVVLSLKMLQRAFAFFPDAGAPHRDEVFLVSGLNPPGFVDSIEFMLRAVTRKRFMIDRSLPKGPPSPYGRFHFQIHRPCGSVELWVKDGLLPDDFAVTGHKVENRYGNDEDIARWTKYKRIVGEALIPMKPEEILDAAPFAGRRFS